MKDKVDITKEKLLKENSQLKAKIRETNKHLLAEKKLRKIDLSFHNFFENSPYGIIICQLIRNKQGEFIDILYLEANPSFSKETGYILKSLIGKKASEIASPEEIAEPIRMYASAIETGTPINYEQYFPEYDRTLDLTAYHLTDDIIIINFINVSDRKKADKELKISAERFDRWKSSNFIGMVHSYAKGDIVDANDNFLNLIGYSQDDLKQGVLDWTKLTPPEFLHLDQKAKEEVYKKGTFTPYEKECFHKDGHRIPVLIGGSEFDEDPDEYIVFIINLSENKRAKTEVEKSEKRIRELFEKSADSLLVIINRKFVDCNEATLNMLKYGSKKELLNVHPSKLSPEFQPDGRKSKEKADEMIDAALSKGSCRFEWDHMKSDGEVFPVEVLLTTVSDEPGNEVVFTTWRDITNRRNDELKLININKELKDKNEKYEAINKELKKSNEIVHKSNTDLETAKYKAKESENKFKTIINSLPDIFFHKDIKGVYQGCNNNFGEFCGKKPEEIIGLTDFDLFPKDVATSFRYYDNKMLESKKTKTNEEWVTYPDGHKVLYETTKVPFMNSENEVLGILGLGRNITDRNRKELELQNNSDILEEMVKKRTKELEEQVRIKDDAMKVFVDREMKILNLESKLRGLDKS